MSAQDRYRREIACFAAGFAMSGFNVGDAARAFAAQEPDVLAVLDVFEAKGTAEATVCALFDAGDVVGADLALSCLRLSSEVMRKARARALQYTRVARASDAISSEQRHARRLLRASECYRHARRASARAAAALRSGGET